MTIQYYDVLNPNVVLGNSVFAQTNIELCMCNSTINILWNVDHAVSIQKFET